MLIKYSTAFSVLDKRLTSSVKTAVNDIATDLLRVAQARAPVDSKTLERSGRMKVSSTSSNITANVTFKATHKGYNYAKKMDEGSYHLGEKSLAKSASGVRSSFSSQTFQVGKGYLTDTAKACESGYREHVANKLEETIRTGGFNR